MFRKKPTRCPWCGKKGRPRRMPRWVLIRTACGVFWHGRIFFDYYPFLGILDKRCPHCRASVP